MKPWRSLVAVSSLVTGITACSGASSTTLPDASGGNGAGGASSNSGATSSGGAGSSGGASSDGGAANEGGAAQGGAPGGACEPSETRLCVGPGGCQGGQACALDGSMWLTCDCGSSGGASGSGGTGGSAAGGEPSTGGSATGGAATGGNSGTGGATFEGECADEPDYATWKAGGGMTGDEVVISCNAAQAGCAGKQVGVPYLWQCTDSHVPNCQAQTPDTGNAWAFVGECVE